MFLPKHCDFVAQNYLKLASIAQKIVHYIFNRTENSIKLTLCSGLRGRGHLVQVGGRAQLRHRRRVDLTVVLIVIRRGCIT